MATPLDLGVSSLPAWLFLLIHAAAFLIGGFFAMRSFSMGRTLFAWGFTLYAIAEISYALYHVTTTTFLLSHTIAEVLNLVAFVLVFVGIGQTVMETRGAPATTRA